MGITIHGSTNDFSSETTIGTSIPVYIILVLTVTPNMLMGRVMFFLIVQPHTKDLKQIV